MQPTPTTYCEVARFLRLVQPAARWLTGTVYHRHSVDKLSFLALHYVSIPCAFCSRILVVWFLTMGP